MTTKRLAPLRDEIWVLELLARHAAVARWRGQPIGSKSRVLQTLVANGSANAVPTQGLSTLEPRYCVERHATGTKLGECAQVVAAVAAVGQA